MEILSKILLKIVESKPPEFRVEIRQSRHFKERVLQRHLFPSPSVLELEIGDVIEYNYPLILYYMKLNVILPCRGRLESQKYTICGDNLRDTFVLRTIYAN